MRHTSQDRIGITMRVLRPVPHSVLQTQFLGRESDAGKRFARCLQSLGGI
jgi:hypothetical protein